MNVKDYNRHAWNAQVEAGNPWTRPVAPEVIAAARRGDWHIVLTESKPVPRAWFPELTGLELLCLASGGGQQGPVLAAAGAAVTVLDASPKQLAQDRLVAEREGLALATVEGDMADLSPFADGSFDLVVHPCSNLFVPEVRPVWREAYRVLRPGGILLAGFVNPLIYLFDRAAADRGELVVRHAIPYSDSRDQSEEALEAQRARNEPLEFGHSLEDQLGGQLEAGFVLTGLYEDFHQDDLLATFIATYLATRAVKV